MKHKRLVGSNNVDYKKRFIDDESDVLYTMSEKLPKGIHNLR